MQRGGRGWDEERVYRGGYRRGYYGSSRGEYRRVNRGRGGHSNARAIGDYVRYQPYCYTIGVIQGTRGGRRNNLMMNPYFRALPNFQQHRVDDAQNGDAGKENEDRIGDEQSNAGIKDANKKNQLPAPDGVTWEHMQDLYPYDQLYYDMRHFEADSVRLLAKFKASQQEIENLKDKKREEENTCAKENEKLRTELKIMEKMMKNLTRKK